MRSSVGESHVTDDLRRKFLYLAWRRYGLGPECAEDIVQNAFTTFLEVKHRYPDESEHPAILAGVFRNKCREYFGEATREQKNRDRLMQAVHDAQPGSGLRRTAGSPLEELIRREDCRIILESLADLRPEGRELFRLVIEEGASRKELIRRLGLNKNTLDSRLHAFRKQFAQILRGRGIEL